MSKEFRKTAIAAYKERKVVAGIYVIRCSTLDRKWVGLAPNLSTIWNRFLFELRNGSCRCHTLQSAWNSQGEDKFLFEEIEPFEEDDSIHSHDRERKERLAHWCAELQAEQL